MNIPGRKKSYASIISPLGGMINNLVTHIKEQGANIITLNKRKAEIDSQIDHSDIEIIKSKATVEMLKKMVITDDMARKRLKDKEVHKKDESI